MAAINEQHEVSSNVVFAAYGRAMAKIGAFEQFMRIALAQHEIARCQASGKSLDTDTFARRLMKMDFGSLAQQVCGKFKFDPNMAQVMKDARGFRNHLAHEFWATQFHNMHTDRGRAITMRECVLYEAQFERVANAVVGATNVDAAAYAAFVAGNAERPEIFKEWEELLDNAERIMRETG
jgi:hypothetical protein